MGLPSPNYQQLQRSFCQFIAYQESMLNTLRPVYSADSEKVSVVFRSVFDDVAAIARESRVLSTKDIEQMAERVKIRTETIFATSFFKNLDSQEQEKYLNMLSTLNLELQSFKELTAHRAEIDQKGLEYFLDQPWAWRQFELLAKNSDSWAINTLKSLVKQNDPKACRFLIYDGTNLVELSFIYEIRGILMPYLQEMLNTNAVVFDYIGLILNQGEWPEGQKILEERFDTDPKAAYVLRDVFLAQGKASHSIRPFILEKLLQDHPIAVDSVAAIFSNPSSQSEFLVEPLIEMALERGSFHFDMLLFSISILSHESKLMDKLEEFLDVLETKHNPGKRYYDKILYHLINKRVELHKNFEDYFPHDTNIWATNFNLATIRTYQLFALRKYRLIDWIEEGQIYSQKILSTSNCFPKTNAVLVGSQPKNQYFFEEISRLLNPHQIVVYSTAHECQVSRFEFHPAADVLLKSDRHMPIWLRDYFFVSEGIEEAASQKVFQYPYWKSLLGKLDGLTLSRLDKHFGEESIELALPDLIFYDLGAVANQQAQLHMLSYILRAVPQLTHHQFQFTYNEGGNCLIGQFKGDPYALIGKNALDINRDSLQEELKRLGFKKNARGKWRLTENTKGSYIHLTDEEMKLFFAQDLGIDPSDIYFVEQAEYHLDMAMAILDEKTVILNDSMQAYRIIEQNYEKRSAKKARTEEEDSKQDALLEARLEQAFDKAQKMKLVEDLAEKDLKENGFDVLRIAGVFEDIFQKHPENHCTNLFNFLSLTTPEGKKIIISLGCAKELQNTFEKIVQKHVKDPVEIFFLNQNQSEALLEGHGGIHCITKCLPYRL